MIWSGDMPPADSAAPVMSGTPVQNIPCGLSRADYPGRMVRSGFRAIGMRGEDADHLERAAEEFKLLQRQVDIVMGRMALDLGVESGDVEAVRQVAIQLDHG